MTDLCQKTSACYGTVKCKESIDQKIKVDSTCDENQYLFGDVPECIKWFFKEFLNYDLVFQLNLTTREDAFISGESCVRKVLNESQFFECDRDAVNFINSNYNQVVNYLTSKPVSKPCQGVYPLYQKLQCEVMRDVWEAMDEKLDVETSNRTEVDRFLEQGKRVAECMSHSCLYNAKDIREVEFRCRMVKLDHSEILECFKKIRDSKEDLSEKFKCLKEDSELKKRRECRLKVYAEMCGEAARDSFEENEQFLLSLAGNRTAD
uniref:DUF19 domain-containing protein n=1 Tax=Caenorhabditis tropicalis TaxID=1561998 RepID=A0A1I7V2B9_9PELO